MERMPKRLTIDPRRESVIINGEYRVSVRPHGKRLLVECERIGETVVLTRTKSVDFADPPKVD